MEIVVGVEGSEDGKIVDIAADKSCSDSACLKQIADPVVYKLVRVDFDGKLVPATDDEFMEVENLLDSEDSEAVSVSEIVGTVRQGLDKYDTSDQLVRKKYKGSRKDNAAEVDKSSDQLEETLVSSVSNLSRPVNQSENTEHDSSLQGELNKRGYAGSKPDFSFLKGEINLDKLTIRELQETFRATFGRKTSVKDKLWLKRRIAMGLTNSCDVSVTSFIIKDGKILKKEDIKNVDSEDSVAGEVIIAGDGMPVDCQNEIDDSVGGADLRTSVIESGHGSDDVIEQKGAKRVRKPTKRYIEESSDMETGDGGGKLMPTTKRLVPNRDSLRLPARTAWGVQSSTTVTRPDSFGGSGVQVPYVSRVRRCRPRKSIISLTKFQTSPLALMRKFAERSVTISNPQSDDLGGDKVMKDKTVPFKEQIATKKEKEKCPMTGTMNISLVREPNNADSRDNPSQDNVVAINSDDNRATVCPMKILMRRKHHRAWTLTEVVKLVDGVSKFGAGRWSEIKKLSFSSCSYRTSVDLKDKWRNLLKASYANSPSEKGVNPARKNAPPPIPRPILAKVRELAEINGQAPPRILKPKIKNSRSSVNDDNRSGYL